MEFHQLEIAMTGSSLMIKNLGHVIDYTINRRNRLNQVFDFDHVAFHSLNGRQDSVAERSKALV